MQLENLEAALADWKHNEELAREEYRSAEGAFRVAAQNYHQAVQAVSSLEAAIAARQLSLRLEVDGVAIAAPGAPGALPDRA